MWISPKPFTKPEEAGKRHPAHLSKVLASAAVLLWVVSLVLPGIATYDGYWPGWEILLLGWISIGSAIPAWLANPFFVFAIAKLQFADEPPLFSSFIAMVFSLTTFLALQDSGYHGAGTLNMYGLGWGGLLWLMAMLIPYMACGIREIELNEKPVTLRNTLRNPISGTGIILWIGVLSVCAALGIRDHWIAEGMDRQLLRYAVFKSRPVCQTPDVPTLSHLKLVGPLQIIPGDDDRSLLTQPDEILSWGIPRVRLGDWDYYLASASDRQSVVTVPAVGPAGALLKISHRKITKYRKFIHARLISTDGKTVGFDGEWPEREDDEKYACPRYSPMGEIDQPPATLLLDALRAPDGSRFQPPERKSVLRTRDYRVDKVSVLGEIAETEATENAGCAANVGIRHQHPKVGQTGLPEAIWRALQDRGETFQIGQKYHWLSYYAEDHAVCDGDVAYVYRFSDHTGIGLDIHPHRLPSFAPEEPSAWWVQIGVPEELTRPEKVLIQSVQREGEKLHLTVAVFPKATTKGTLLEISASPDRTCTKTLSRPEKIYCD